MDKLRLGGFLLFNSAYVGEFFGPEAFGFEVFDCGAGSVLTGGLFGGEERACRTKGLGVAFDGEEAGEGSAQLVVCVCWLGGAGASLEFCWGVSDNVEDVYERCRR